MIRIRKLHHLAIICGDYQKSKQFYTEVLGFDILQEIYRPELQSYKLDLSLHGHYLLELFSFPNPPSRLTRPEARGLRHLAFEVEDIKECMMMLAQHMIETEPLRTDEYSNKRFVFFNDPDNLPIELYEK